MACLGPSFTDSNYRAPHATLIPYFIGMVAANLTPTSTPAPTPTPPSMSSIVPLLP